MATIYIVDYRPISRQFLVNLLRGLGHELQEAADGVEALALLARRLPELMILDVDSPVEDVRDLVARLRADPGTAGIAIIFYTDSYRNKEAHDIATSCGVRWVLPKFGNCRLILQTVAAALGQLPACARSLPGELHETSQAQTAMTNEVQKQRKLIEEACLRTSELLVLASTEAPAGVCIFDGEGRLLWVNRRLCEDLGYPEAQLLALSFFSLAHPDDSASSRALMQRMMSGEIAEAESENRCLRGDGRIIWVHVRAGLLKNGGAKPLAIAHVVDVTQRRRATEALRVSEERFQLATRGANLGLWDWDVRFDEVYYSPRWLSMLGYAEGELEKNLESWKQLLHPEDEPFLAQLRDVLEGNTTAYSAEFRMRHKDGHYLDILSRGFSVYDDQGKTVRIVGTHVDITERKKLEEQFRQAQKMEAIGQLAGGVAHDFNNILSLIIGYTDLTLDNMQENDPSREYLTHVLNASGRATLLTQSLLAFSRKQKVDLAVIDLNEVIKGFEKLLLRLIREDITLKTVCAADKLAIVADRGQIEQVLMNLVTNARDAMPNGGNLVIQTRLVSIDQAFIEAHRYGKEGEYALVSVSDDGIGMDSQTASHVFEPFFTTKELGKGTGLGLSMVYGTVKKHEGFINACSEPGKGAVFNVYFPRVSGENGTCEKEAREAAELFDGTETILVGEDDAALRSLSVIVLTHYGYRVIEAVDGQDAIDKFFQFQDRIQLVVLDGIMPKKNGKEACKEMRTLRPDLKTVFVSGYPKDIFSEDKTSENAVFIQKPVSPKQLLAKVRELLDSDCAEIT